MILYLATVNGVKEDNDPDRIKSNFSEMLAFHELRTALDWLDDYRDLEGTKVHDLRFGVFRITNEDPNELLIGKASLCLKDGSLDVARFNPIPIEIESIRPEDGIEVVKLETIGHKNKVKENILRIVEGLLYRAETHDDSKLKEPELSIFAEWGPKLSKMEYGSDEYKEALAKMGEGLKHHYEENLHHPEHFENGIRGMDIVDVVEMICDWKAASERMKTGDFKSSLEYNRKRFEFGEELEDIFRNTDRLWTKE